MFIQCYRIDNSDYYSTQEHLLQKAFPNILNCCDIHFIYVIFHMANLLNRYYIC